MPSTKTVITVNGSPLGNTELAAIRSVSLAESLGEADRASITVTLETGSSSAWTSPLDSLVAPATPFTVELSRGEVSYRLDARSVSASWNFDPGSPSTLTVEGMDRSVELDREDVAKLWQESRDSAIAEAIFGKHKLKTQVQTTPVGTDPETYAPQQNETDWSFLRRIAGRHGYDVHIESIAGAVTGVFGRIDPIAKPQATIRLGYGEQGGKASVLVKLMAGQKVHVTRTIPGTSDVQEATDPGTGNAMGERSLGGVTSIRTSVAGNVSVVDAAATAKAMAERSAFGATLTTKLNVADMPLLRARRTVTVAGLGQILDGLWLVSSVEHTITPGGHTQELKLIRNALGVPKSGGSLGAALSAAVSL